MTVDLSDRVLEDLATIVGSSAVKRGDLTELYDPGIDPDNLRAKVMVRPKTPDQVAGVAALCNREQIPIVPQGGRTGLSGGATTEPGQLVVDLTAMDRIVTIDPQGETATVESGVRLETLQEAALAHGLSPGIDLAARGSATVGGLISTNAGGIEAFRCGTMAHRLLGVEAVLASGEIVDELKQVPKANEGYRLTQLLAGAEGTLGIVTRAVVRLEPARPARTTALVSVASAAAANALFHRLMHVAGIDLLAAELMWPDYARVAARDLGLEKVLKLSGEQDALFGVFEVAETAGATEIFETTLADASESGEIADAVIAKSEAERGDIWRIREDSWSIDRQYPHGFWYDVSVPRGGLDAYVAELEQRILLVAPDFHVFAMGHLGDGNLHLTITSGQDRTEYKQAVTDAVYHGLVEQGGSFSAEHGIGTEKRGALRDLVPHAKLDAMRAIKKALDPLGIMNPGKVL